MPHDTGAGRMTLYEFLPATTRAPWMAHIRGDAIGNRFMPTGCDEFRVACLSCMAHHREAEIIGVMEYTQDDPRILAFPWYRQEDVKRFVRREGVTTWRYSAGDI